MPRSPIRRRRGHGPACAGSASLGAIGVHKGYDVLLACARDAAERDLPLSSSSSATPSTMLGCWPPAGFSSPVASNRRRRWTLIRAQDASLALLPSVWPETWNFGLTELWRAGLSVAAFDFGAPAERIRRTGRGFLLPLGLPPRGINNALVAAVGLTGHEGSRTVDDALRPHPSKKRASIHGKNAETAGRAHARTSRRGMTRPEPRPRQARRRPPTMARAESPELRVSGHLMTLDSGLFCVFQAPGSPPPDAHTGLPGVRITLPPGASGRPDAINISTFREDGWLNGTAALVRVADGSRPGAGHHLPVAAPGSRNGAPPAGVAAERRRRRARRGATSRSGRRLRRCCRGIQAEPEIVAHVQRTGDVGGMLGDWIGTRGSGAWIEGFAVKPREGLAAEDIEYQGVLGRGWLSPWVEGGKFCGSRGMALPLLGIKLRLKGAAARQWECSYEATFTDGSKVGPVSADETCEAESLASLEAFRIELRRRNIQAVPAQEPTAAAKPARPARPAARAKPGGR